jgi:hypothetical protein
MSSILLTPGFLLIIKYLPVSELITDHSSPIPSSRKAISAAVLLGPAHSPYA